MRVSRRGRASRLTSTLGGDGRDTEVHHLVPDLADPFHPWDGRVPCRGRCFRLRVAVILLSCTVAATACGGSGNGAPAAAPSTSAVTAPLSKTPNTHDVHPAYTAEHATEALRVDHVNHFP